MSALTNIIDFFKEVRVELAKVVWPTRAQTLQLTIMVIIVTVVVGFFIGGIDYLLAKGTQLLLSNSQSAQTQTIPVDTTQQQLPIQVQPNEQQVPTDGQQPSLEGDQTPPAQTAPQQ